MDFLKDAGICVPRVVVVLRNRPVRRLLSSPDSASWACVHFLRRRWCGRTTARIRALLAGESRYTRQRSRHYADKFLFL